MVVSAFIKQNLALLFIVRGTINTSASIEGTSAISEEKYCFYYKHKLKKSFNIK